MVKQTDDNRTTIQLSRETKNNLDKFKVTPSQTYEEVLEMLMQGKYDEIRSARKKLGFTDVGQGFLTPIMPDLYAFS